MHKSQFLLNEVKYSNSSIETNLHRFNNEVAIPFKWGQVFQRSDSPFGEVLPPTKSQSLLNEVKYSNLDVEALLERFRIKSQSLLNEVKYSNIDLEGVDVISLFKVAIPFKWGQVFQRRQNINKNKRRIKTSQSLLNEVKYSNTFKKCFKRSRCCCRNPF